MADKKISALTAATTPLAGTEVLPIVQGGSTVKVSAANLTAGRAVAASSITTTGDSSFNGLTAGKGNGSFATNTAFGVDAALTMALDGSVTAIGYRAARSVLNGSHITAVGNNALGSGAGPAWGSTAIGSEALFSATTGVANTAIGGKDSYNGINAPLRTLTTGSYNIAIGSGALTVNNGSQNVAVGNEALMANTTGIRNVAVGNAAIKANTASNQNTGVGVGALTASTGSNNTAIGYNAGNTLTSGANNAFFGHNAQPSGATVSNEYTYGDANVATHRFPNGNLVVGTAGKGIDFSAVTNPAGTTSELLAAYAEGTWTPTVTSSSGAITSYTASGNYTRIGNRIFFSVQVTITDNGTGAGLIDISLPYTAGAFSAGSGQNASTSWGINGNIGTGGTVIRVTRSDAAYPAASGNTLRMFGSYII